ncbi:MAG: cupin domain-containing protein [Candidatus Binataceae bacterium]
MINERRRVITGHDKDGKSFVAIDGPPGAAIGSGGAGLGEIWVTDQTPEDNSSSDDRARRPIRLEPPRGGSIFRYFALDPENPNMSTAEREAAAAAAFKAINGEHCRVDTSRNPGMHTTRTVDYIILLDGEVTLLLDRGEVKLKPFDVVVQRGTNHAWVNHGPKRALLVAVLIDAEPL